MTDHPLRWGLIGPGHIARSFAIGLRAEPGARLVAVASRTYDKASAFAREFGADRAYGSYAELAVDNGVDAVYVATPHPQHQAAVRLCLEAGKAVLCEKPITVNARELDELIALARTRRVFLMEAMWTRFLPAMVEVRQWLADVAIGEPRLVTADFGFRCAWNPASRLLDRTQAGGGVLGVRVYVSGLAPMGFGSSPEGTFGFAHLGETGVDEQAAMILGWSGGRLASLTCAVRTATPQLARIDGTEGSITVPEFWHTTHAELRTSAGRNVSVDRPHLGNGYEYQAIEVARCLAAGLCESPVMPLAESLSIQRTMDELRQQWGLTYPCES